jgi:hypothetical protein
VIDSLTFNNNQLFNARLKDCESENDFTDLRQKIKSMENNMER